MESYGINQEDPLTPLRNLQVRAPHSHALKLIVFPTLGVSETREAPSNEGASRIFVGRQKNNAFSYYLKALR